MPETPTAKDKNHLSLLDESPKVLATIPEEMEISGEFDALLDQASKWKSQMEGLRDELLILQLKNAILLDNLTMAAVDM